MDGLGLCNVVSYYNVKVTVYERYVMPMVMYGREVWCLSENVMEML